MNKMIKKGVLVASVMAVAAFAMPAMASAANWYPLNGNATLSSSGGTGGSDFAFTITGPGYTYGFGVCTGLSLGVHVRSPASSTLDITSATGFTCQGFGFLAGCTVTATPTALPWTASGASTTNVTLNNVNYNVVFTGASCQFAGASGTSPAFHLQGTLTGGVWTNPIGSRGVTYSNDTGLSLISPSGGPGQPMTTSGGLRSVGGVPTLS